MLKQGRNRNYPTTWILMLKVSKKKLARKVSHNLCMKQQIMRKIQQITLLGRDNVNLRGKYTLYLGLPRENLAFFICFLSELLKCRKYFSLSFNYHPIEAEFCHAHFMKIALAKVTDEVFIAKSSILSTQISLLQLILLDTAFWKVALTWFP